MWAISSLFAIFLPEFHAHLLREGLDTSFFSTGWFLHLYTQTLGRALCRHVLQRMLVEESASVLASISTASRVGMRSNLDTSSCTIELQTPAGWQTVLPCEKLCAG